MDAINYDVGNLFEIEHDEEIMIIWKTNWYIEFNYIIIIYEIILIIY